MKLKTKRLQEKAEPYVKLIIKTDFNDCDFQTEVTEMSVEDFDFVSDIILDLLVYLEVNKDKEYPLETWMNKQSIIWHKWCSTEEGELLNHQHPFDSLTSYFPYNNEYDTFQHGHSLEEIEAFYYDVNGIKHQVIFERA